MDAKSVLIRAKNILEQRGWTRGYGVPEGPLCIVHAIQLASRTGDVPDTKLTLAAIRLMNGPIGIPSASALRLGWWNDDTAKDASEVYAAIDKAVASA
jgi:hypothetical protein